MCTAAARSCPPHSHLISCQSAGSQLPPKPRPGPPHSRTASAASGPDLDLFSDPSLVIQPEYGASSQHTRQQSHESLPDPFAPPGAAQHAQTSSQGSQPDPFGAFQQSTGFHTSSSLPGDLSQPRMPSGPSPTLQSAGPTLPHIPVASPVSLFTVPCPSSPTILCPDS